MKLSFSGTRPSLERPAFHSLLRHIEGLKRTLYSLSTAIRFDTSALDSEQTQLTVGMIEELDRANKKDLQRYGGNKELYDLVMGMTRGELLPLEREEYGLCPPAIIRKLSSMASLIEFDEITKRVSYRTLKGTRYVGDLDNEGSVFKQIDTRYSATWNFGFDVGKPEEITGTVGFSTEHPARSPEGFETIIHKRESIRTFRPGFECDFVGKATLELNHPSVHLGGLSSIFVDHETVYREITKTLPYPEPGVILETTHAVLKKFRLWLIAATLEEAGSAIAMFNEHSRNTLIRIDGYLSKKDFEENKKTIGETYSYRIVTCREVEHNTVFRGHFTEEKTQIYTSPMNDTIHVDFLTPYNGPTEEFPERFKVNSAYTDVGLIRLVSGIEDFLMTRE